MVRGVKRWVFDGRVNGKRKRMYFDKKSDAEAYLKLESQDTSSQQWWLALSHSERSEIMAAFNLSKDEGFSLGSRTEPSQERGRRVSPEEDDPSGRCRLNGTRQALQNQRPRPEAVWLSWQHDYAWSRAQLHHLRQIVPEAVHGIR